uniref:complement factor H-like isoform X2 n=1 Tax=Myodes glareolus TaxID=447135 RepID=UPI0020204B8F|nr:complement factor H-like isoform X2 [Myodes glareolus]
MRWSRVLLLGNVLILGLYTAKGEEGKPCDFPRIKNGGLKSEENHSFFRFFFPAFRGKQLGYYCNRGFVTPSGTKWDYIRCTVQGWEPAVPCLKACSKSDIEIENGFFSEPDLAYHINKTTQYKCKQGYVTANGKTSGPITCLQNGWSAQPSCIKSCDRPIFENAGTKSNSTWFKLNDKLDYECHVGYENRHKDTKGSITCNYDGWSDKPSCYERECSIPLLDPNLIVDLKKEKYKVGDLLKFSCRPGHRVGPDSVQCYDFGWSPSFPTCKGQVGSCVPPPELLHGVVKGTKKEEYVHGEAVEYDCKPGFLLKGPNKIECVDGKWTTLPTCVETDQLEKCKAPRLSSVGAKLPEKSEFNHNFSISYKCRGKQEYKHSICINGRWDPEPTCTRVEKKSCPPPPQIPNARVMETTVKYWEGEKVSIICQDNYLIQDTEEMVCRDGRWQSLPRCVAKIPCSQPPEIDHGSIKLPRSQERRNKAKSRSYKHSTTLSYVCDDGFRLAEDHGVTCHMGKWSAPPRCVGLPCGPPPSIHHGIVSHELDIYQHGEEVTYSCSEGFGTDGSAFIKCVGGKWSQPPACIKTDCDSLPRFENAVLIEKEKKSYRSGEKVMFKCAPSYQMDGSNIVTCVNRMWIGELVCKGSLMHFQHIFIIVLED